MNALGFEAFREQWLEDIRAGAPSTAELGRRFAHKLFTQWRDVTDASDDLVYCDGPADGGIDLAYLERGEADAENAGGDTWYVVQSKYGSSFQGTNTLLRDGQKIIETLAIGRQPLTEISGDVTERIRQFLSKADPGGSGDRLVLVFATEQPLSESERRALDGVRAIGRDQFGNVFDTESISIETIYLNQSEDPLNVGLPIEVPIEATMVNSGKDLMVGAIPLLNLYDFLKAYRAQTENLDQLYEKNVRRFLGGRGKVNKGMQATLNEDPAQFGLYNNGITIVVKDFAPKSHSTYLLTDPYIVNGCQTTRTLWEMFRQKLESGGKGTDPRLDSWASKVKDGVVIAKVVRVGNIGGEHLLENITRYTNSQNAVKDKDFITLFEGFQRWKQEMASRYDIFLEVQRGGWDSQNGFQKQNPQTHQFSEYANAFDLLKVYGSGWLREAGRAFGSNKSFVPGGPLYRQIVERTDEPFGVDDLYAAHIVQKAADLYNFGRGSKKTSRRQTRYLFYMVVIDLLRDVLLRANMASSLSDLTQALLRLHQAQDKTGMQGLFDAAVGVVDEYLTQGEEDSVFGEVAFTERNNDLSGFLKSEQLGKGDFTPNLVNLMAINKRTMGRGNPSPRDLITQAIK